MINLARKKTDPETEPKKKRGKTADEAIPDAEQPLSEPVTDTSVEETESGVDVSPEEAQSSLDESAVTSDTGDGDAAAPDGSELAPDDEAVQDEAEDAPAPESEISEAPASEGDGDGETAPEDDDAPTDHGGAPIPEGMSELRQDAPVMLPELGSELEIPDDADESDAYPGSDDPEAEGEFNALLGEMAQMGDEGMSPAQEDGGFELAETADPGMLGAERTEIGADTDETPEEPESAAPEEPEAEAVTADTGSLPAEQLARQRNRDAIRAARAASIPPQSPIQRNSRIITIDAHDEVLTEADKEAILWHEIQNAYRTRHILTGTIDALETTPNGMDVAVVTHKGFDVLIPLREMMIYNGPWPNRKEYALLRDRFIGSVKARMFSEIDFTVRGIENSTRKIAGSRRAAMYRKRQIFYLDQDASGTPMIYEGCIAQARVVAVSEKAIRVEVFGVECSIRAQALSWEWIGNAHDKYSVGDRILVRVQKIRGTDVEDLAISADVRSTLSTTREEKLSKVRRDGDYVGVVTDVHKGPIYVHLKNGVNAIAHDYKSFIKPGKGDVVNFHVTLIDRENGNVVGLITRVIRQKI